MGALLGFEKSPGWGGWQRRRYLRDWLTNWSSGLPVWHRSRSLRQIASSSQCTNSNGGRYYRHCFVWQTRHTRDRSIYDTYLAASGTDLPLIVGTWKFWNNLDVIPEITGGVPKKCVRGLCWNSLGIIQKSINNFHSFLPVAYLTPTQCLSYSSIFKLTAVVHNGFIHAELFVEQIPFDWESFRARSHWEASAVWRCMENSSERTLWLSSGRRCYCVNDGPLPSVRWEPGTSTLPRQWLPDYGASLTREAPPSKFLSLSCILYSLSDAWVFQARQRESKLRLKNEAGIPATGKKCLPSLATF